MDADWVVCMDFGRPEMTMVVPILSFLSFLIKGLSGMGEALVFGAGWQLFLLAGYQEMDDLGLLAGLICVMQCASTAVLAAQNGRQWWHYAKHGSIFSVAMLLLSPLGNHIREVAPTESVQLVLAVLFLNFALLKLLFDGLMSFGNILKARSPSSQGDSVPSAEREPDIKEPDTREPDTKEPDTKEPEPKRLPDAPLWLLWALPAVGLTGGFLGGLCGMNGPPFILMTAVTGLDKAVARNIFPMGQAMEVWTFRLPMLIASQRILLADAHIYCVGLAAGALGLQLGNFLAPYVSQKNFERGILLFLVLSSLSVLGLLQGRLRAIVALGAALVVLLARLLCGCMEWRHAKAPAQVPKETADG
ncbi:unnamed protein product [Effrenium voratum]|nr:unnamed protein product [Effrenium voratum]CAJ1428508.1 unnamed protein product [Effrenium voratum]